MPPASSQISEHRERAERAAELSPSVRDILGLACNEGASVREVTALCEGDLALTARVIGLVNSCIIGPRKPVRSLLQAMVILGVNRVRNLSLTFYLTDRFQGLERRFPLKQFWKHSLTAAGIARGVAPEEMSTLCEDFYLAGMLHDMGVAFLCGLHPDEYPAIFEEAARKGAPLHRIEREALGTDHAELGWEISSTWKIPESVRSVVRWHHAGEIPGSFSDAERVMLEAVILAGRISRHCGCGLTERRVRLESDTALPEWLLDRDTLLDVAGRAAMDARDLVKFFSVLPGPAMSFP